MSKIAAENIPIEYTSAFHPPSRAAAQFYALPLGKIGKLESMALHGTAELTQL
jgi:uncharacterized protein (DUF2344 family)